MKRTLLVLSLAVSSCMQEPLEPADSEANGPAKNRPARELGTITAIYPEPRADGGFDIELRMTRDTVRVDLESLQEFASDSAGKALIRSTVEKFYTRDEKCLFNPNKDACMEFRRSTMETSMLQ